MEIGREVAISYTISKDVAHPRILSGPSPDPTFTRLCTFCPSTLDVLNPGTISLVVRPGESGGRYVCELLASLPDSSA